MDYHYVLVLLDCLCQEVHTLFRFHVLGVVFGLYVGCVQQLHGHDTRIFVSF